MAPGTVIHVSRDSGFRHLADLAPSIKKMLTVAYLPAQDQLTQGVWVTVSKKRRSKRGSFKLAPNPKMFTLLLEIAPEIELWHTYTSSKKKDSSENPESLMPSGADLYKQFSHYLYKKDAVKITGVLVTEYGATYYWWNTEAMAKAMEMVIMINAYDIVIEKIYGEAEHLRSIVRDKSIDRLPLILGDLAGIFRYGFVLVPK